MKKRVAVIEGADSNDVEYLLQNFPEKYEVMPVLISHNGAWHRSGMPTTSSSLHFLADVALNTVSDKKIQKLLEQQDFRTIGSGTLETTIASNVFQRNKILDGRGIRVPMHMRIGDDFDPPALSSKIFNSFVMPVHIRPTLRGRFKSFVAKSFSELKEGLHKVRDFFDHKPDFIIEEHISGREVSCLVLDGFRRQKNYVFLPLETQSGLPVHLSEAQKKEIEALTLNSHKALGLRHFSLSHFTVSPRRGIYLNDIETHPRFAHGSLLESSLFSVGATPTQFLEHVVEESLR